MNDGRVRNQPTVDRSFSKTKRNFILKKCVYFHCIFKCIHNVYRLKSNDEMKIKTKRYVKVNACIGHRYLSVNPRLYVPMAT